MVFKSIQERLILFVLVVRLDNVDKVEEDKLKDGDPTDAHKEARTIAKGDEHFPDPELNVPSETHF